MSVKEGKSPWGMTEEQKHVRERWRETEYERQYGGEIRGKREKGGIEAGTGTSYD